MAEKEVRKTTAKKTIRRSTTKVAPRKTAVRKTTDAPSKSAVASVRKAPARTSVATPRRRGSKKTIVLGVILLCIVGASVAIGYSDKGQIDVTSLIAARKQNATPEEQQTFESVPVQQGQSGVVNGGLVGTGAPSPLVPTNPAPQSASTTPDTATSSDDAAVSEDQTGESDASQQQTAPEAEGAAESEAAEEVVTDPIPQ
jgi:hypothetical protein